MLLLADIGTAKLPCVSGVLMLVLWKNYPRIRVAPTKWQLGNRQKISKVNSFVKYGVY